MQFVTPIAVSTLNSGRIQHNKSLASRLQNFHGSIEPIDSDVSIQGDLGLLEGMLWSRDAPNALKLYNLDKKFSGIGLVTVACNSQANASTLLASSYFEPGELVFISSNNTIKIVDNTGSSFVQMGVYPDIPRQEANNSLQLSNVSSSNFLVSSLDAFLTSNLQVSSGQYIQFDGIKIKNTSGIGERSTSSGYTKFSNSNIIDSSSVRVVGATSRSSNVLSGTSITLECNTCSAYSISLSGDTTIAVANVPSMSCIQLTVTSNTQYYIKWPTSFKWSNGIIPIPPSNNANSVYSFITVDSGNTWYATSSYDS